MFVRYVTILSGDSVSDPIATDGMALVNISMPSAWTAADIGYKGSWEGLNAAEFFNVYDGFGNAQTTVAAASTDIAFPLTNAVFTPFIKLTSVATGTVTPVVQGGDRKITLIFRKFLS